MPISLADHPDLLSQHACGNPHDALLTLKSYHLWRCPSGHDFRQRLEHRIGGVGCGVCAGKQIIHGVDEYHENKTSLYRKAGVKLIHVAQRDWETHRSNCHALVKAELSESVSSSSKSRSEKR